MNYEKESIQLIKDTSIRYGVSRACVFCDSLLLPSPCSLPTWAMLKIGSQTSFNPVSTYCTPVSNVCLKLYGVELFWAAQDIHISRSHCPSKTPTFTSDTRFLMTNSLRLT